MSSLKYNETSILTFLSNYESSTIDFFPNLGNIGDMLIHASTFELFRHFNIKANILRGLSDCKNKVLFVSGGGNLVDNYSNLLGGLRQIENFYCEICILPHTIFGENSRRFFANISTPINILCREQRTYDFLNSFTRNPVQLYLCPDLAFHFNFSSHKTVGSGVLNAFRKDSEKTQIPIPSDNFDISQDITINNKSFSCGFWLMDNWEKYLNKFIEIVASYEMINTNRLHVAIAAACLEKKVYLFPNSYYKNEAIYNYSLRSFDNVTWLERIS